MLFYIFSHCVFLPTFIKQHVKKTRNEATNKKKRNNKTSTEKVSFPFNFSEGKATKAKRKK